MDAKRYICPGATPVDKVYIDARLTESVSLAEFVAKLGKIPLAY